MLDRKIKIGVIDLKINNIQSIVNAYKIIGCNVKIINKPEKLKSYNLIVLPGVGAFKNAKKSLMSSGLETEIKEFVSLNQNKILFGICLGMQLFFEKSYEFGEISGMKLIKGEVKKFNNKICNTIPHMSWNKISLKKKDKKFEKFSNKDFYFVHSYYCEPKDKKNILFTTSHQKFNFCSGVKVNNIFGVQFHPEKSGKHGINFLKSINKFI